MSCNCPGPRDIANEFAAINRRQFLGTMSMGLGFAAMSQLPGFGSIANAASPAAQWNGVINPLHFAPKAKRIIFLCMAGGPSQFETFDDKPELRRLDGTPMPGSFTAGMPIAQLQNKELKCMGPRTKFDRHGESGLPVSQYLPHIASIADDITVIKSMVGEQINHDPAHMFMNTGSIIPGRPSMGSWINYGLGSESDDLPGFIVLTSVAGRDPQPIAARQWTSGFLPSRFTGVEFMSKGDPVHYIANPKGISADRQEHLIAAVRDLNHMRAETTHDPEIDSRIAQYELAFRMQMSVPELTDMGDESPETLAAYGARPGDGSFASNCLLARRLAERGVRFIQLYHRGWDHHSGLDTFMPVACKATDRPTAALINDLKQRGLLDDTLVIWGGEFGRTPMSQGEGDTIGRDHHVKGFTMFMAGGGIKGGHTHGETDDLGYHAVKDVVHVRDLHATVLHQLGIDHEQLAVRHHGLNIKLTGLEKAHVVTDILT